MFACCSLVAIDPCQLWTEQEMCEDQEQERATAYWPQPWWRAYSVTRYCSKVDIQAVGPPFLGEFPAWDSLQICTHVRGYKEGVRVGLISNIWFSLIPYTSSMNFWCQLLPTWNEEILEAGTFFLVVPICWPWKSYYSCQRAQTGQGHRQTERDREPFHEVQLAESKYHLKVC